MENKTAVTETPAELEQVIKRILDIDAKAKTITGEAKEERAHAERNIARKKAALREEFLTHAREKIEELRVQEDQLADAAIAEAGEEFDRELEALEAAYKAGKEKWVEEIYQQTISTK